MRFDSLSATLLARALPFLRNRIPRELDVTGPLSLQAKLGGTFNRRRLTDVALKVPLFGSSNYNAILEGSVEIPEGRPWAEAQLKGSLLLNPINLTQLRNLPFLKQTLPVALATEGSVIRSTAGLRVRGPSSCLRLRSDQRGKERISLWQLAAQAPLAPRQNSELRFRGRGSGWCCTTQC